MDKTRDLANERIVTFDQFWLHYLREHGRPATRALHFTGILAALLAMIAIVMLNLAWQWLLALPAVIYAFAFSGHYLSEHNHPTTYKHPVWSLISFFRMFRYWLTGRLPAELKRAGVPVGPDARNTARNARR